MSNIFNTPDTTASYAAADVQNSVAWMKEYLGRTEQEGGNDRGL